MDNTHVPDTVPLPASQPTLPLWPDVGLILGLSRGAVYRAANAGQIPILRIGGRILVPTAGLRRMLMLDDA